MDERSSISHIGVKVGGRGDGGDGAGTVDEVGDELGDLSWHLTVLAGGRVVTLSELQLARTV